MLRFYGCRYNFPILVRGSEFAAFGRSNIPKNCSDLACGQVTRGLRPLRIQFFSSKLFGFFSQVTAAWTFAAR
jgi:hypothetical protein